MWFRCLLLVTNSTKTDSLLWLWFFLVQLRKHSCATWKSNLCSLGQTQRIKSLSELFLVEFCFLALFLLCSSIVSHFSNYLDFISFAWSPSWRQHRTSCFIAKIFTLFTKLSMKLKVSLLNFKIKLNKMLKSEIYLSASIKVTFGLSKIIKLNLY